MIAVAAPAQRRDGVGLDAVPVLRAQGAEGAASAAAPTASRVVQVEHRRRLRRQGGVPVDDRRRTPRCSRGRRGRPVKIIYDRAEDMAATTKRHPVAHAASARRSTRDGRLVAIDIDFVDRRRRVRARCRRSCCRAARSTRPARTAARTCACAAAPSRPTRRRTARSAASARRRRIFAHRAAHGRSRARARRSTRSSSARRNFLHDGRHDRRSARCCAEPVGPGAAARRGRWRRRLPREARRAPSRDRRAGAARASASRVFFHGAGFTGSGEEHLASARRASRSPPTGASACSPPRPTSARARTRSSRRSPPSALGVDARRRRRSSQPGHDVGARQRADGRVAHVHGRRQARRDARRAALQARRWSTAAMASRLAADGSGAARRATSRAAARCAASSASTSRRRASTGTTRRTRATRTRAYAWAVYVAEVSVDLATCEAEVDDFVARAGGRHGASTRRSRAGQIEGGVAQAIGWALSRTSVLQGRRDGERASMTNYIMPDRRRRAADPRRSSTRAPYAHGPRRREGHRRAADGRPGAGDRRTPSRTRSASTSTAHPAHARALMAARRRPRLERRR